MMADASSIDEQVRRARADKAHGRWFSHVLSSFRYLEVDFGYRLAEVQIHFRGSHVRYEGPVFDLVTSFDPEDTGHVGAELWVRDDLDRDVGHPRAIKINELLRARDAGLALPDLTRGGLREADVRAAVSTWAVGLLELAPDVLRGEWPEGVSVSALW